MAVIGKILGAVIGLQIGGPLGAILGAVIGHNVVDKNDIAPEPKDAAPNLNDRRQLIYFTAVFSCLAKMAKADGVVDKSEINVIDDFMRRKLGFDDQTRRVAIEIFGRAKDDRTDIEQYLNQLAAAINWNHELCLNFIYILHEIAAADGKLHHQEIEILNKAERIFRLPGGTVAAITGESPDDLRQYYSLLECTPQMTDAQIKAAYRKKCKENHPDRMAANGMPEEFTRLANEKTAKINEAYEKIMKSRKK